MNLALIIKIIFKNLSEKKKNLTNVLAVQVRFQTTQISGKVNKCQHLTFKKFQ